MNLYEKLFNTVYSVTTHSYLKFKLKMVFGLGSSDLDRDVCVNFIDDVTVEASWINST